MAQGRQKLQRITGRSQFQKVLASQVVSRTAHFALHRVELQLASTPKPSEPEIVFSQNSFPLWDVWMGVLLPKRWARRAVTRNTIKRLIHHVAAEAESALKVAAYVVRMRASFDRSLFPSATSVAFKAALRKELQQLLAPAFDTARMTLPKGEPR